jgi:hypothetical protein
MDIYNTDNNKYLAIACIILPVIALGMKRMRDRAQELHAAYKVRRVLGRKGNVHRKRGGVVAELMQIDDDTFERMFRMPKRTFIELETRVAPLVRAKRCWTIQSARMATVSSGSAVDSILLLAATIRCTHACQNRKRLTLGTDGWQEVPFGTLRSCSASLCRPLNEASTSCATAST